MVCFFRAEVHFFFTGVPHFLTGGAPLLFAGPFVFQTGGHQARTTIWGAPVTRPWGNCISPQNVAKPVAPRLVPGQVARDSGAGHRYAHFPASGRRRTPRPKYFETAIAPPPQPGKHTAGPRNKKKFPLLPFFCFFFKLLNLNKKTKKGPRAKKSRGQRPGRGGSGSPTQQGG